MKIKISIDDDKTRRIWASCLQAREEVASWSAWKRGDDMPEVRPELPPRPGTSGERDE